MASRKRIRRIARNVLLILAGLALLFFLVVVPWFFTHLITYGRFHYADPNDGKTPKSYGMDFRWVGFRSPDDIALEGWYIPASGQPKGTIVYCHGLNRTRIEMLPDAQFGHTLGFDGLLFDFRHQGRSAGKITTLGYQERLDVEGAVRYALQDLHAARPVILWGVSMGASAALLAAAETPDVTAVISDSSFLSFDHTIEHHLKLFLGLPAFPIAYEIEQWVAWRGHFRPSDFDLENAVERIGDRPILFVAVGGDRRMPPAIAETLYAHARSPLKKIIVLPGHRHGEGFNQAREPYEKAVEEFLASLPSAR